MKYNCEPGHSYCCTRYVYAGILALEGYGARYRRWLKYSGYYGGSDLDNVTIKVINALEKAVNSMQTVVVVGGSNL